MTILEALKARFNYPLSDALFQSILIGRGLSGDDPFTAEVENSPAFNLAWMDGLIMLLTVPNITEGDLSITLSDRNVILDLINSIRSDNDLPPYGKPTVRFLKDWC